MAVAFQRSEHPSFQSYLPRPGCVPFNGEGRPPDLLLSCVLGEGSQKSHSTVHCSTSKMHLKLSASADVSTRSYTWTESRSIPLLCERPALSQNQAQSDVLVVQSNICDFRLEVGTVSNSFCRWPFNHQSRRREILFRVSGRH